MEKTNRKWGAPALIGSAFAASAVAYARMPALVPAAWDAILLPKDLAPQPVYVPRAAVALVLPAIALLIFALLRILKTRGGERLTAWLFGFLRANPSVEDLRVARFEKTYDLIATLLVGVVVAVHFMSLALAFGAGRPIGRIFVFLLGILFAAIGNSIPRLRPNMIMGFRTKRTINDPALWQRAHRLFGVLVFCTGIAIVILALTEFEFAMIAAVVGLLISLLVVAVYVHAPRRGVTAAALVFVTTASGAAQAPRDQSLITCINSCCVS
jgi:hypothetical protein